ncbi:MAG: hypothetical protein AAGF06_03095 [Pseudomonadota bacterium]
MTFLTQNTRHLHRAAKLIVSAALASSMLVLTACSGSSGNTQSQQRVYKPRPADFPAEIPYRGRAVIKGKVAKVVRCPSGARCLVGNHIVVVSPRMTRRNFGMRGLMVFPPNVNQFQVGQVYRFNFHNGQYRGVTPQ